MSGDQNKEWYVADFETKGKEFVDKFGYTEVWLWAICDSESNIVKYGETIEDFFLQLSKMRKSIIYFHNLKFDGSFILNYLEEKGFKWSEKLLVKGNRGYSTLIGEMGEFYEIKINFARNKQVIIRDSLKLLPFKVKKIAKDFNLEIEKEVIDYSDYVVNDKTLSYIYNDVRIVAQALKIIKANGMTKMTTASCAYNNFKELCGEYLDCLPILDDDFLDTWRNAYRGGRSQVNPIHRGKILEGVKRYDINSMYPSVMRNCYLPYGKPIKQSRPHLRQFELYKIAVSFRLKKDCLPTLLKKGSLFNSGDTYYIDSEDIIIIYISNIDYELLERNYEILSVEFLEIYGFSTSKMIFRKYIDKYYKLKCETKGAERIVYKLMLNSLYGKFGSNHKGKSKIPEIKDGHLSYYLGEEKPMTKYYLPMAIAITSYAHKLLDDYIHKSGIKNFVYCDTDSIHTLGEIPEDMIDQKELGKFKLESIEKKSKYVRQKCYAVQDEDGSYTLTCAGLPQELKDIAIEKYGDKIFDVFDVGFSIEGKLLPKQVRGGVVLEETTFKIK